MVRLKLWPWFTAGGGSKDQTSSGTDQAGAVEVLDSWRGTGSTWEGLQWWDDELGGNLGFELKYVQKSGARQLYLCGFWVPCRARLGVRFDPIW
jgi:hypothetical protein